MRGVRDVLCGGSVGGVDLVVTDAQRYECGVRACTSYVDGGSML